MTLKTGLTSGAVLWAVWSALSAASRPSPRPASGWTSDSKIACAYFFYWYDAFSGAHFRNPDGTDAMTDHPPADEAARYSYSDPAWCRRELLWMIDARIDVVLPVYWGDRDNIVWSRPGLQNLVAAALQLSAEGVPPPRFGMFLDSASFPFQNGGQKPDLTKNGGAALAYKMIKDYWTLVPRDLWALVDGKPLIFLYTADFVSDYNQRTFDLIAAFFERDFGAAPFIIRESTWEKVRTDGVYAWGVALNGPRTAGRVGSLGPGFDDRAVPGRPVRQFRDRECGDVYRAAWREIAASGVRIVGVETWNEWHEATEVAPSYEYGRHFVDMTAEGVRLWKETDLASAPFVWLDFGRALTLEGLRPSLRVLDGAWKVRALGNREGAYPDHSGRPPSSYIYLDVGNDFVFAAATGVWLTVEYYDKGRDGWFVEYDAASGPYARTENVVLTDTKKWRRKTFRLRDAFFGGRQNYGADLRIGDDYAVDTGVNFFGRVWISKSPPANRPPALIRVPDVELVPHKLAEIPLVTSDADGRVVALTVSPPVRFARVVAKPGGGWALELHPDEKDSRACPYKVTVLATDDGSPPLSDAMTVLVVVKS